MTLDERLTMIVQRQLGTLTFALAKAEAERDDALERLERALEKIKSAEVQQGR